MIGQYFSNTNEIGTIHILPKILELNKALGISKNNLHPILPNIWTHITYTGHLFSFKIFWKIDTIILSFVFDKYYPIID